MSQLLYGSICLSDLNDLAKKGHKAFSRAQNGKIYVNVNVWINDEQDNYGNIASIQCTYKDSPKEDRPYIGNLKGGSNQQPVNAQTATDIPEDDDLPF